MALDSAASRILERRQRSHLVPRNGCSLSAILRFEAQSGYVLPLDLREFLLTANGLDNDGDGFAFWPLEAYAPASHELASRSPHSALFEDADRYFVFCDYLDWSWAYAIRLSPSSEEPQYNYVVPVGMNQVFTLCDSFSEFVELYLSGSANLYPP